MKTKLMLTALAVMLQAMSLVAANVNGFENFVLSRNDFKSNPSRAISGFSSRTRTELIVEIPRFNSGKPCGFMIIAR